MTRIQDCHGVMFLVGELMGFDSLLPYEPAELSTTWRVKQAAVVGRRFDPTIALLEFVVAAVVVAAAATESAVAIEFVVNVAVGGLSGRLHYWPSYSPQTNY